MLGSRSGSRSSKNQWRSETFENSYQYSLSYQTTTIDSDGEWNIIVSAVDSFGNTGSTNKTVTALTPQEGTYYDVIITSPTFDRFFKKESIQIIASVLEDGVGVSGATVTYTDPFGNTDYLIEGGTPGFYGTSYQI